MLNISVNLFGIYYFGCNNYRVFSRDIKMLCIENHKVFIKLKGMYDFRSYNLEVKNLHQCMHLLVAKLLLKLFNVIWK